MSQSLINPQLDRPALARTFKAEGKVRVAQVLQPEFAERVYQCLESEVPWRIMHYAHDASGTRVVGRILPEQQAAMGEQQLSALRDKVNQEAKTRFQYLYEAYDVLDARRKGLDPRLYLQKFLDFMGSDELFGLVREITGDEQFNRVDCHACRYLPGHFLKEHADTSPFEHRRMAYVFYFTRDWHADFGGLTLFLDDQQQVTDAFVPDFNSLTLFKVPVAHCVTQVASFAPRQRNSVTGWFTRYN